MIRRLHGLGFASLRSARLLHYLTCTIRLARTEMAKMRNGTKKKSAFENVVETGWNWLPTIGLVLAIVGHVNKNDLMAGSCMALWIGRIVSYFSMGIITEHVAGIPQRLTYGGWKVDRFRGKRRRK
jgi:hypothetical protein